MTAQADHAPKVSTFPHITIALLVAGVFFSYWTTLGNLASRWSWDPQYSHGYLVPAFAVFLLWATRSQLTQRTLKVSAFGLGLLMIAAGIRLAGTRYHFEYLDQISLLPACAGMFLLAGGWSAFFWSLPAVLFLAFMIPLPHSVSMAMSGPMQSFATIVSTFVLQLLGKPALAEGNVILLNEIELGIVEACSGLRMLVVFFALSTAVALLITKPRWEKLFIALSAIPIALASNVIRIVVTGLFYDAFGNNFGGALFHDLAGWLMMPLGLAFLGVELWILNRLLIERISVTAAGPAQGPAPAITLYQSGTKPRRKKVEVEPEPVEAGA